MINKKILTLITLCSLCFISCGSNNSGNTKQNFNNDKYTKDIEDIKNLDVTIELHSSKKHPLSISLDIANNTNQNILLPNKYKGSYNTFKIIEDGKEIDYIGPTIEPSDDGTVLQPETSYHYNNIDISKFYATTNGTHRYEITLQLIDDWSSNTLEFDATLTKNGAPKE